MWTSEATETAKVMWSAGASSRHKLYRMVQTYEAPSVSFGVSAYAALCPTKDRPRLMMSEILAEVAQRYGITVADLRGPAQRWAISHPRQEAMWLMRQQVRSDGTFWHEVTKIARYLNRDHTTVLHGIAAHAARRGLPTPRAVQGGSNKARMDTIWRLSPEAPQ